MSAGDRTHQDFLQVAALAALVLFLLAGDLAFWLWGWDSAMPWDRVFGG